MTFRRLAAIAFIFLGTSIAWTALGSSLVARSGQFNSRLEHEVELLWGPSQRQAAPNAWIDRPATVVEIVETKDQSGRVVSNHVTKTVTQQAAADLESTRADVELYLEQRQRGLLWYPTYNVAFRASYTFRNPDRESRTFHVRLPLPAQDALFDDFAFTVDGRPSIPAGDVSKEMIAAASAGPNAAITVGVQYRSRGIRTWTYAFAAAGVAQVRDFHLVLRTNFQDVDFPAGTVSPSQKMATSGGWTLSWTFSNLISGQAIGMEMPQRLNPGPFAARVTFFAPVSLLFFLAVMVIVGATSGPVLHPMHYWFIAAAFFAFHLLLAYLVDHVGVHTAFGLSAAVSVSLVVSYLRLVTGLRQALCVAGAAQSVFLVLFSYAFFFEGFAGLAITIGAVITLFVLMQMTAHVSWDAVFLSHSAAPAGPWSSTESPHADHS